MSVSSTNKKLCVTCKKSGGILICDGCRQVFCGKHVVEHRQHLSTQLDHLMQQYDVLQQETQQSSIDKNTFLTEINQWEIESISKIKKAAKEARKNLKKMLNESKDQMKKTLTGVADKLRSSREADDFSEVDLNEWSKRIEELTLEVTKPSSIKLTNEKNSSIPLITVTKAALNVVAPKPVSPPASNPAPIDVIHKERFSDVLGRVTLSANGLLASHTGPSDSHAYIRGQSLYENQTHRIRFRIEKCQQPYKIFFGCTSYPAAMQENEFKFPQTMGWFGSDQVHLNGKCASNVQKYGYRSGLIGNDDVINLKIDCKEKSIRFHHERTNMKCLLKIDDQSAPLPWKILIVLYHPGDSVRIIA